MKLLGPFLLFLLAIMFAFIVLDNANSATVELQWDANSETDLAGYRVKWKNANNTQPFPNSADIPKTQTTATLSGLNESERWFFAVTAYNTAGQESSYSNVVEVYFLLPPANVRVYGLTLLGGIANVSLTWNASTTPVAKYKVCWANISGNTNKFTFSRYTTVTGLTTTIKVVDTQKWYVRVMGVDAIQESRYSNLVELLFIRTPSNMKFHRIDIR